jgi:hypothetical protein
MTTESTKLELRKCPFCGREGILDFHFIAPNYFYFVSCDTDRCPSNTDEIGWNWKMNQQEAINAWEIRPLEQQLESKVKILEEALEPFTKIECDCIPAYKERGLAAPDCTYHNFVYEIIAAKEALEKVRCVK